MTSVELASLGTIASLAVVAMVLIGGKLLFWTRYFLGRGTDLAASGRGALGLEMVSLLAAVAGLLGTFLQMRIEADSGGLARIFTPSLAGLGLFVIVQGALGVFRAGSEALRTTPVVAADVVPQPSRARRPAPPAPAATPMDSLKQGTVFAACALASILFHGAVFYAAHRVQTAPPPASHPEREGVFVAKIVDLPRPPEPIKEEAPPPPPPPVEPPKPEPATVTEQPKAEPAAPLPPVAEAKTETKTEEKEIDRGKPAAAPESGTTEGKPAAAPPPKITESAAPAPQPAAVPPSPKVEPDAPVLGLGAPAKNPEGITTLKSYRQFLAREMKAGTREGQYLPHLRFADNLEKENREITRYFGMELIAYPKDRKFYIYIDPDQGLFSRSSDFTYLHNFSSRAIFRTSPYFDGLRAEAAKRVGVPADSLVVAQLLKPSSASYIGWKESECAKRAGVGLEEVEACDARFARTPFGIWIVKIERLLLKDGRTLAVEDFEWTKVGGDR
jgi:hypothetical protein